MTLTNSSLLPGFVREALDYAVDMTHRNLKTVGDFPELAKDGQWHCVDNGGWVAGHWVGLLWLAFVHTQAQEYECAAREWAARLFPRQTDPLTHDLGFLFELSCLLGARLTHDTSFHAPALQAAHTLGTRFNDKGNFIQAWGPTDGTAHQRGRTIIDTLMNLRLLFWASDTTGEPHLAEIALAHAHTALRRQVRADWSTSHVADFDPDTGEFIKQDTCQGLSATSCWSRGQSWAVYGFAECYRYTHAVVFLDAARHIAGYALHRLPPDLVPFWDYASPLIPDDVRDSSAASILATGLLNLASVEPTAPNAEYWRVQAISILASLWENYSSRGTNEPCLLLHGTRSKPEGSMDHGLIYGDYYFVEALTRLARPDVL
jgi:unsaturated chondroitin disaccharide hydrolase